MIKFNDYMEKYYEKPWIFKKVNEMMLCFDLLPIFTIKQAICRPTWLFAVGSLFVDNFLKFQIIKFVRFFVMQVTVGPYQLRDAFIPQAVAELGVDQTKRQEVTFQPLEISIWWYDTNNSKFVHINLNDSFSQINLAVNYFKKLFATIHVFTHSLWSSWDLFSTSLASELLLLWWFPHVLWSLNQHHFLIESEWTKLYIKDR